MSAPFVQTLDSFMQFTENNQSKYQRFGGADCKECPRYKTCLIKSKNSYIETVLHLNENETRHPGLLNVVKRRSFLLSMIPAVLYKKAWGMFSPHLACPFNSKVIFDNLEAINKTYSLFSDEDSKLVYLNVLMYRITLETDYILRAYSKLPEYFIPGFCSNVNEIYVDCGAYDGDSFISCCQNNVPPRKAYLFEPDHENVRKLKDKVFQFPNSEIHVIDKGVYCKTGKLFFTQGMQTSSYLSEVMIDGSEEIDVTSIDDAVSDEVTFIKMDIEGSEQDALLGAQEHIRKTYPKLAICIYHRIEDLWEIPLMIQKLFPEYSHFELHHHSTVFTDTVLYVHR